MRVATVRRQSVARSRRWHVSEEAAWGNSDGSRKILGDLLTWSMGPFESPRKGEDNAVRPPPCPPWIRHSDATGNEDRKDSDAWLDINDVTQPISRRLRAGGLQSFRPLHSLLNTVRIWIPLSMHEISLEEQCTPDIRDISTNSGITSCKSGTISRRHSIHVTVVWQCYCSCR